MHLLLGKILENIYSFDMFALSGSLADQSFCAQVDLVHLILIRIKSFIIIPIFSSCLGHVGTHY